MAAVSPFFIAGLPRSGTTFLANFLTAQGIFCWHEALLGCPDMSAYIAKMTLPEYDTVGDSDSALPLYHRNVRKAFPKALWIGIDRDPSDVAESLERVAAWPGAVFFSALVDRHRECLRDCDFIIPFRELFQTETLRNLWQTISDRPFDERRAEMLVPMRVQPNLHLYWPKYRREIGHTMEDARCSVA